MSGRTPSGTVSTLLWCGIVSAVVYVTADLVACLQYPGFSFTDQAVSELFAIGAPTAGLVVPLFSLASTLLLFFAAGVWRAAGARPLRLASAMLAVSAVNALVLWNIFPMHNAG